MSRLTEIEARLASATPGPWQLGEVTPMPDGWPGLYADVEPNIGGGLDPNDAELIAHAPGDLAALVAVVNAVRAARRDLDHHHAHMVPGRWDNDGSPCDVCARVGAMDEALQALEAM